MKLLTHVAGAAVAAMVAMTAIPNDAAAIPANGSFGFVGTGNFSVDTGSITVATATKTLPVILDVNTIVDPFMGQPNNLGITLGDNVTLSAYTLPIPAGLGSAATNFDVSVATAAGTLTFTFTMADTLVRTPSGNNLAGALGVQYLGTLSGDTSGTFGTGTPAILAETCNQSETGAAINCSDTLSVAANLAVPEPASLALLGSALLGFGWFRRRRTAA